MKYVLSILVCFAVIGSFPALAFPGGNGGHACGGHVYVASGHHSHHDTDAFMGIRTKICTGYVVYGADTLDGIIVCSGNYISLRTSELQDSTWSFYINDTNLRAAMMQENHKTLFLERMENKKLYRVVHTGKLCVYDTYFSFDHGSKEFFNNDSWVRYQGRSERLNNFWTTSIKRKLINRMNTVYGLALKPGDYKKTKLLEYLESLN